MQEIITDLASRQTRDVAIVGGALLDEVLWQVIETKLANPAAMKGQPRGYDARVKLAEALGAISPTVSRNLTLFGYIRNDYAHAAAWLAPISPDTVTKIAKLDIGTHFVDEIIAVSGGGSVDEFETLDPSVAFLILDAANRVVLKLPSSTQDEHHKALLSALSFLWSLLLTVAMGVDLT